MGNINLTLSDEEIFSGVMYELLAARPNEVEITLVDDSSVLC